MCKTVSSDLDFSGQQQYYSAHLRERLAKPGVILGS